MLANIELQDYGLILLALAAFGFIVSDAFKIGRCWGIPIYRNNIEKVFHYISNAIIAIVSIFFIFLYFIINHPKSPLIVNFASYILKIGITENILIGLLYFTFFYSVFYILAVTAGAYMHMIFHYFKKIWIHVYLIDYSEPRKFAGLITESKDFFFFQKDDIALWEAIKKDQIVRMETIIGERKIGESKIKEVWDSFHLKSNEYLHNLPSTIKTFVYRKQ